METPFDNLLSSFNQTMLDTLKQNAQPSELFSFVYNFLKILRVLYGNMAGASEKMQVFVDNLNKQLDNRMLSVDEMHAKDDVPIRCKLSYVQFIDHLNRTGRVLKRKGFTLPCYGRIYFFRNKMVEHLDDYVQFLLNSDGLIMQNSKIAIPYAFAALSLSQDERRRCQQQLADEFAKSGVTLPSLEGKWQGAYANLMFTALEKIDADLRKIPEPLVTLLFKYGFPTPISDIEDYCKTLAAWITTLPLL